MGKKQGRVGGKKGRVKGKVEGRGGGWRQWGKVEDQSQGGETVGEREGRGR